MRLAVILVPLLLGGCATGPVRIGEGGVQYSPTRGFVRGAPETLAMLDQPLPSVPGPNRTVDACTESVKTAATKAGASEIDVASQGVEQQDEQGNFYAPVRFRITYPRMFGYDVREQTLICVTTPEGKIVEAYAQK